MSRILVVGTGSRFYREYMLSQIAQSHEVLLVDAAPPTWQEPHISSFRLVDPLNSEALLEVARSLEPDAVLTWVELYVPAAARLAEELGVRGVGAEASHLCRDKALMRGRWREKAVPSAVSVLTHTLPEAEAAASGMGYPVVVKPRALGASVGVVLVRDNEELRAGYRVADESRLGNYESDGVLVEEYLQGPEISVESVVQHGTVRIVAVTRKRLGEPPYFEEVGHIVDASDPLIEDPVLGEAVQASHQALGVQDGVTHAEIRLTPSGPRLVELGARPGGDLIPYLVELAVGVKLSPALAEVVSGRAWEPLPAGQGCAAVHFVYPTSSGFIKDRVFRPEGLPDGIEVVQQNWFVDIGDRVDLPPEGFITRTGSLVLTATDASLLQKAMDDIDNVISVETEQSV